MKRWKQQRLQNQAIQIGQALYQHNVDEVNIDPEIDDIIDINSININNTIDDPIISNVNVSESRFLNDAIDKIKQLSCDEPNIIMEKDISCALVLLKKRHRLSARCMDDIISLLRIFNVPNVPSSWYRLKKSLTETQLTPIQSFICSECQELSTSSASCSQCNCHFSSTNKPNYIFSFPIQNQIERILHYNKDILPTRRCYAMSMTDICDGALHQKLQSRIQESFLALTLNVDRIQPNKGSQKTIWPILLVINELPLKRRFAIENIILAGVWPGPSKPSRTEMSLFFRPLVEELVTLEQGAKFQYQDDNNSSTSARIFLIGACCDKPAQALLQFLPEPIATFGCGRCEVEGSNEHDQLSTSSEVNSVHKESSLNKRTAVDDSSDDNSEFESEMDENEKNNDDYVLKSNGLTSSNKKKKSSALKITKSGAAAAAKRLLLDNSIDSINIDEQQLDISQLANYMKELNVNNKHLMK
ncbi:unnamed protein product [Rotaria socialis]|uniref:Uncharacterized protein n=1 Tax=Rotaria socialis TaxID=392032 RepID=A0A818LTT6_9BILA|nr:unnamed protein product [Rotaria socialis]